MARKIVDTETRTVTFDVEGNERVFDLSKVSESMLIQLALHGASQKIGDSYAGAKSAVEGTDESIEDYTLNAVETGIEQLYNDDWSVRTGGSAAARVTDLARAVAEATGMSESDAVEQLDKLDADQKKALRKDPAIEPILARLSAERAQEKARKAAEGADSSESKLSELFS